MVLVARATLACRSGDFSPSALTEAHHHHHCIIASSPPPSRLLVQAQCGQVHHDGVSTAAALRALLNHDGRRGVRVAPLPEDCAQVCVFACNTHRATRACVCMSEHWRPCVRAHCELVSVATHCCIRGGPCAPSATRCRAPPARPSLWPPQTGCAPPRSAGAAQRESPCHVCAQSRHTRAWFSRGEQQRRVWPAHVCGWSSACAPALLPTSPHHPCQAATACWCWRAPLAQQPAALRPAALRHVAGGPGGGCCCSCLQVAQGCHAWCCCAHCCGWGWQAFGPKSVCAHQPHRAPQTLCLHATRSRNSARRSRQCIANGSRVPMAGWCGLVAAECCKRTMLACILLSYKAASIKYDNICVAALPRLCRGPGQPQCFSPLIMRSHIASPPTCTQCPTWPGTAGAWYEGLAAVNNELLAGWNVMPQHTIVSPRFCRTSAQRATCAAPPLGHVQLLHAAAAACPRTHKCHDTPHLLLHLLVL